MPSYLDEDAIEQYAIDLLKNLDYAYIPGSDIAPGGVCEERASFRDAVLLGRLRSALARLNPNLPNSALEDAFSTWKREDGAKVSIEIEPLVNEVFEKRRLLDIIRYSFSSRRARRRIKSSLHIISTTA